jgi:hypothetical protein
MEIAAADRRSWALCAESLSGCDILGAELEKRRTERKKNTDNKRI